MLGAGESDVFMIGHHHEDQGVQHINGKYYDSHGSIARTGSHANDLERRPATSYVEISREGIKIQLLRPKLPPAEDIMDLDRRKEVMAEKKKINEFMESLQSNIITSKDLLS